MDEEIVVYDLKWDDTGEKLYETGVDRGVLYKPNSSTGAYDTGFAWNGLTAVNESPEGADATDLWADNAKYISLMAAEKFGFTIEAYTYPEEFEECDGSASVGTGITIGQQTRKPFGFCYRTKVGNDISGEDFGYKLHLVYGCKASPSARDYATINDSPEAITFSWEINTTPVAVTGKKPTATLTIDSTKLTSTAAKAVLASLEQILYGTPATTGESPTAEVKPRLPLPDEIITMFDDIT